MIKKVFFILLFVCSTAHAGLEDELKRAFSSVNANITEGGAFKSQQGGYYTGGGAYVRVPTRTINPVNIQLPTLEMGCNGLNAYMGAFSYLNSDKLVETLKAIGANATTYAFSLALKQMSPMIMNQLEELHAKLNWANEMSINSCNAAKAMVNTGASLLEEASVGSCIRNAQSENNDYFKAKHQCQTQQAVNARNKNNPESIGNLNLVWDIIQKDGLLKTLDKDTQQLIMSLTGTIVFKTAENQPTQPYFYFSKLHGSELVAGLAAGKPFSVYNCQDEHCLNLSQKEISFNKESSFVGQVHKILGGIEEKTIEDEEELTEKEKAFLETTRLPVYKFFNVQSAFQRGMILSVTEQYAEVISNEILHAFIDNSISDLMSANKHGYIPSEYVKDFTRMVEQARKRAGELRRAQVEKFGTYETMEARVRMMEAKVEVMALSLL